MSTALTNCPSCGAPLDRSATACSKCATPIIKSGGEETSQAISAVGDTIKKTAPTGAAVAIHLCGVLGDIPFLAWLWLVPLICAFLTEGNILRTHARVWWRWQFDLYASVIGCTVPIFLIALAVGTFSETIAWVFFIPACLIILAGLALAIINAIKAAMAASDGIVYTYPKLLLSRFGII